MLQSDYGVSVSADETHKLVGVTEAIEGTALPAHVTSSVALLLARATMKAAGPTKAKAAAGSTAAAAATDTATHSGVATTTQVLSNAGKAAIQIEL